MQILNLIMFVNRGSVHVFDSLEEEKETAGELQSITQLSLMYAKGCK